MRGVKFALDCTDQFRADDNDRALIALEDVARWLRFRYSDSYNEACVYSPDDVRRRLRTYR